MKESFGWRPADAPPFLGKVEGSRFRCWRDIRYRNSFLPRIAGRVVASPDGAKIEVTMHLHPVVFIFMLFWLGAVGAGALLALHDARGLAVLIPTLLYYGGGWLQYGYRYFLDSVPFVVALCGMAAVHRGGVSWPWRAAIVIGTVVMAVGVYWAYHL